MAQQNHADLPDKFGLVGRGVNNKTRAPVEAGRYYYLGGSGNPDIVLVTRTAEDRFWYRGYPYYDTMREMMIDQWIGADLIARAEETMRQRIREFEQQPQDALRDLFTGRVRKVLEEGKIG